MTIHPLHTSQTSETSPRLRQPQEAVLVASGTLWALTYYAETLRRGGVRLPRGTDHEDVLVARSHAQYRLSRAVLYSMSDVWVGPALRPAAMGAVLRLPHGASTLTSDQEGNLQEGWLARQEIIAARQRFAHNQPFSYQHELVLRAALVHTASYPDTDWRVREAYMVAAARGYHDLLELPIFAAAEPQQP